MRSNPLFVSVYMATLSVCCLAKNEEEMLPDMISSVREIASEIIVLDTGSTDRTREIARDMGARSEKTQWTEDFAMARNKLIDLARGEWILMIDADERIHYDYYDTIEQAIVSKQTAYVCTVLNVLPHPVISSLLPMPSIRLFRKNDKIRFRGRVHESIESSLRKLTMTAALSSIKIEHLGYTVANDMRRLRNRRVFESELSQDPTDAWLRFHLGLAFYLEGDYTRTEEYLNFIFSSQSLEIPKETRSMLVSLMADIYYRQGKKMAARSHALRAIQMGGNAFAEYLLATLDMLDDAVESGLRRLLDIDAQSLSRDFYRLHKGNLYADIAKGYMRLDKFDRALQYAELAREDEPSYEAMLIGGILCERKHDLRRALQFYTIAQTLNPMATELQGRIAACRAALGVR